MSLPSAQIARTVIWFSVRVPVLSVQITVVDPNVSTAGSRRTTAWPRAMRVTPIARVIVSAAGRPSGIAPTARATAAMKTSEAGSPADDPDGEGQYGKNEDSAGELLAEACDPAGERGFGDRGLVEQAVNQADFGGAAGRDHDAAAGATCGESPGMSHVLAIGDRRLGIQRGRVLGDRHGFAGKCRLVDMQLVRLRSAEGPPGSCHPR